MGVSWLSPFELDITDALLAGINHLEIYVTNQWTNKLIGDERYPTSYSGYKLEGNFPKGRMMDWYVNNEPLPGGKRTTFCTGGFYKAGDPLTKLNNFINWDSLHPLLSGSLLLLVLRAVGLQYLLLLW